MRQVGDFGGMPLCLLWWLLSEAAGQTSELLPGGLALAENWSGGRGTGEKSNGNETGNGAGTRIGDEASTAGNIVIQQNSSFIAV